MSVTCYKNLTIADSCNILRIVALCDQERFGKHYFMSSINLLRIVVNKSHYPKFLVNLYFCIIDGNFDSIRIVTEERIRNTERIMNLERIRNKERIRNIEKICLTPSSGNMEPPPVEIRLDPTSGNMVD